MSAQSSARAHSEAATRSSGDLGWALAMVLRRWQERVEQVLEGLPQGARGYQVLSVVEHEDLPTQAALAAHLAIDRTVMTYLIDALEKAGLVARTPDPTDRRVRRIVTTEAGRRVLADAEREVAEVEEYVLQGLAPSERILFQELIRRTAERARDDDPSLNPCQAVQEAFSAVGADILPG